MVKFYNRKKGRMDDGDRIGSTSFDLPDWRNESGNPNYESLRVDQTVFEYRRKPIKAIINTHKAYAA